MGNTRAVAVVPEQELIVGNLYVSLEGQERPVLELHADDPAYARHDVRVVLRQHPDAYFRLRVKPDDLWPQPAGLANAPGPIDRSTRKNLEAFLGQRLTGVYSAGTASGTGLTKWGWFGFIGSALNAVGLLFFPLADSSTLASLKALGGKPTPLAQMVSGGWFSPLLAALTAACLVQALRVPSQRKLWIGVSYLPLLVGFVAALAGFYSAYTSVLDSIK